MGRLPFFSCDWSSERGAHCRSCVRLVDLSIAHLTIGARAFACPRLKCIKIEKAKAIADARGTHQPGISCFTHDGKAHQPSTRPCVRLKSEKRKRCVSNFGRQPSSL